MHLTPPDLCVKISIHALMKRATGVQKTTDLSKKISIHALMKRATFRENSRPFSSGNFNPRSHEESD
ncbi:MAG: hypothetical protein L0L57_09155, partial [Alkalibacterium sp.]|nr:hypothetical protein [Alkalibacterium sp.]MDN6730319.1 hypothetical protein [Alkalibacterium sp.]